jgi:hypothetical protein
MAAQASDSMPGSRTAMARSFPWRRLWALALTLYPSFSAACQTSWIFSTLTLPRPLMTLETVPWETPASRAMSLIVGIGKSPLFRVAVPILLVGRKFDKDQFRKLKLV